MAPPHSIPHPGRMLRNSSPFSVALAVVAGILLAALLVVAVLITARFFGYGGVTIAEPATASHSVAAVASVTRLSTDSVPQGGAFAVEIHSNALSAAKARFLGRDYPLVDSGNVWFAVLGAGQPVGSVTVLPAGEYPVAVDYQLRGSRTADTTTLTLTVQPVNFPTDAFDVNADLLRLLNPELEAEEAQMLKAAYSAFTPVQQWSGPFVEPVNGEITTVFAARRIYGGGPVSGSHEGVDIGVPLGTPVHASAAGTIAWTGELPDRGQGVIIDHGLGVFTGYFHLSEIRATAGQRVGKDDTIGLVGTTGFSTGPHVHWEVVIGETNVDGLLFEKVDLP
jgi:murein DD-endopeptidase MepM/ murein hydrolase activator NlpD